MNTFTMLAACEHIHTLLADSQYTVLSVDFKPYHAVLTFRTTVKICFNYEDNQFYRIKADRDIEYLDSLEGYLSTCL